MERGRIEPGSRCKAACVSKDKKARTAAKAEQGMTALRWVDPYQKGLDGVLAC